MRYERYLTIARNLVAELAPACVQIEIAGGLRRHKPDPHDIELVAIPRMVPLATTLFGEVQEDYSLLDEALIKMCDAGQLLPGSKSGPRFKQFLVPPGNVFLDLFIVRPPAQWGYLLALRTGPAHYSKWLVTRRNAGGALPLDLTAKNGALWRNGELVETPDEATFFNALGIEMPAPRERSPRWGLFMEEVDHDAQGNA